VKTQARPAEVGRGGPKESLGKLKEVTMPKERGSGGTEKEREEVRVERGKPLRVVPKRHEVERKKTASNTGENAATFSGRWGEDTG